MLNHCVLTGNLGGDPEIRYTANGDPVATLNLAFRFGKDQTGWIKVTCFKKLAELCEKYLHKGARIGIDGYLTHESWETQNNEKRTAIKIIANSLEFIKTDGRGFKEGEDASDLPF